MFAVVTGFASFLMGVLFTVFKTYIKPSAPSSVALASVQHKGLVFVVSSQEELNSILEKGFISPSFHLTNPLKRSVRFMSGALSQYQTQFYFFKKNLPSTLYIVRIKPSDELLSQLKYSRLTRLFYVEGNVSLELASVTELPAKKVYGYKGFSLSRNFFTAMHVTAVEKLVSNFITTVVTLYAISNVLPVLLGIPQLNIIMPYVLKFLKVSLIS